MKRIVSSVAILVVVFLFSQVLLSEDAEGSAYLDPNWGSETTNNPICTEAGNQTNHDIMPDGQGGAIMVWQDQRGADSDIYAQRTNKNGGMLWTINGTAVCSESGNQTNPALAKSAGVGAIIVWEDDRSGNIDIYAQRVDANGVSQWAASGVEICTEAGDQTDPRIINDGIGGAIIVWTNESGDKDIYAQRIDNSGTTRWVDNGTAICSAANDQEQPVLVTDGLGGAIIAWQDGRGFNIDIYAQKIGNDGLIKWTIDGEPMCAAANDQTAPQVVSDSLGGAIIVWQDGRGADLDIYAQRTNDGGTPQWTGDGVQVCTAIYNQTLPVLTSDDQEGAIIAWQDERGISFDIFAQRVNDTGNAQWTADGIVICDNASDQNYPYIAGDGLGGAIIVWQDGRGADLDIYAQRAMGNGTIAWEVNGVEVSVATGSQVSPRLLDADQGGTIIVWQDNRTGSLDIYSQRTRVDPLFVKITNAFSSTSILEDVLYVYDLETNGVQGTWSKETNAVWLNLNTTTGRMWGIPRQAHLGTSYVNITVVDDDGGSDYTNFTITITNVNGPPIILGSNTLTVTEDNLYNRDYDAFDEEGDTLNWSLTTNAGWLSIDNGTGVLSGTPNNGDVGSFWANVRVEDPNGGSDYTNFTITVDNVAPIITNGDVTSINEDSSYVFDYSCTDDGQGTVTWSIDTNSSWLNIHPTTGVLSGVPRNDDVGTWYVNVTVNDGNGGTDNTNFTVDVTNTLPTISTIDTTSTNEDALYYVNYASADDGQGNITWQAETNATWLSFNNATGEMSGTPNNTLVGEYFVNITVYDGNGGSDEHNFTLMVVNTDPVIPTSNNPTADEDVMYVRDYSSSDDEQGNITWSVQSNATWLSIEPNEGTLWGQPDNGDVGSFWVNVTVYDGNGGSDSKNFTLTVYNVALNITTTTPPGAIAEDMFYNYNFNSDDDGQGVVTWALNTDAGWLILNASTGMISGNPNNADVGVYYVNVSVNDGNGGIDFHNYTLDVINMNPMITTGDVGVVSEDTFYSVDYNSIDDGQGVVSWGYASDAGWLSFNSTTGFLNGTPDNSLVGSYYVNVSVDDGNGGMDFHNFSLVVINAYPNMIAPSPSGGVDEDVLYSYDFNSTDDGQGVITWDLISNAGWLGINSSSGVLAGTPDNGDVGSFWANVSVDDGNGGEVYHNYTVTVDNVVVAITNSDVTFTLEDSLYGVDYNSTDDSQGSIEWSLDSDASWLNINSSTGVLSGTPDNSLVGSYYVNVSVDDGNGGIDFHNFTLDVYNVELNITSLLPAGFVDEDVLYSYDFNSTDDGQGSITWALDSDAGWLALNASTGVLNGTPDNGDVGSYYVKISVDDGNGGIDFHNFTLDVYNVELNITSLLPAGFVDEDVLYSYDFNSTDDGQGSITWALDSDAGWLALNASTGVLNGTPDNGDVGSYYVNISVDDGNGGIDFHNFTLDVNNSVPIIIVSDVDLTVEDVLYGVDYNSTDDDGQGSINWVLVSDAGWLGLNTTTGMLEGTPDNSLVGSYYVNVSVDDGNGGGDFHNFTLDVVNSPPVINVSDVDLTDEDVLYGVDYNSIDDGQGTITWALVTDAGWLGLNTSTGMLEGTPDNSLVGSYYVNVSVDDGNGGGDFHNFTLDVTNVAPILNSDLPSVSVDEDVFYSFDLNSSDDGQGSINWVLVSDAGWLGLNSSTGELQGIANNSLVGSYYVNVSVDDGNGGVAYHNYTLNVTNIPLLINVTGVPFVAEDSQYSVDYNSTDDGQGTITWALVSDAGWLGLNSSTGLLSGTPDNSLVGSYYVNVSVDDGNGGGDFHNFTLDVTNVAPILTDDSPLDNIDQDLTYSYDFNSSDDGQGTMTWVLVSDAGWLNLDGVTGELSGITNNSLVGSYYVNVRVGDGNGGIAYHNYTLNVTNVGPVIQTLFPPFFTSEGGSYYYDFNSDEDGEGNITWALDSDADWLVIDNVTGELSGTPDNGDVGSPWVSVSVDDGNNGVDYHNFTVFVNNIGVSINTTDILTAFEDTPYYRDYNSSDDGQGTIKWDLETAADWLVIDNVTGELSGTPDNSDVGSPWVNVSVDDGNGGIDFHNFTLVITNVELNITSLSPMGVIDEDEPYYYDFNSTDDGQGTITWILSSNASSWLSINATTGVLSGTANNSVVGSYYVNVSVNDGNSNVFHNFTLDVNNVALLINVTDVLVADEDSLYHVDYNSTDDGQGNISWSLESNADWLVMDIVTGELTGTANNSLVGTYYVNVSVGDGNNGSDFHNFTLEVINVGPVVISTSPAENIAEDVLYSYDLNSDEDGQGNITWSLVSDIDWLSINETTGVLNGTPDNGDVGSYIVEVNVSDGNNGVGQYNFTLNVTNVDPIITTSTPPSSVNEDTLYSYDLNSDEDGHGIIAWSLDTNAGWLTIDSDTGMLTGTPDNWDVGNYIVNITLDDGNTGKAYRNYTLDVHNVNDAPVIITGDVLSIMEDNNYSVDYDATDDENDIVAWALTTNAIWLVINETSGELNGTPENSDVGPHWVNVSVSDGNGGSDHHNFTLVIENFIPSIMNHTPPASVNEDAYYLYDFNSTDDGQGNVSWWLNTNADWLNINSTTGSVNGTPDNWDVGTYYVNVSVDDGYGRNHTNYSVIVYNVNDAPVIITNDQLIVFEDVLYVVDYNGSDDENDILVWTLDTNASWLSINGSSGLLFGTPDNSLVGTYYVNIHVSDGNGGDVYTDYTLAVNNTAPAITTTSMATAIEDSSYYRDYASTDDGKGHITWSLSTNAPWLDINPTTGVLSGTPDNQHIRSYSVTVTVDDGNGGKGSNTFSIAVTNTPPTISIEDTIYATERLIYSVDYASADDGQGMMEWNLTSNATWLSINSTTGILQGTPNGAQLGLYYANVTVDDGNDGKDFSNFTIEVLVDSDGDWMPDVDDPDDDGDGYPDELEEREGTSPLNASDTPPDVDGDLILDSRDEDIDGDGVGNQADAFPYDPAKWEEDPIDPMFFILPILVIVALVLVLVMRKKIGSIVASRSRSGVSNSEEEPDDEEAECPTCGEALSLSSTECPNCGEEFEEGEYEEESEDEPDDEEEEDEVSEDEDEPLIIPSLYDE